jgi:predicted nucleic acid-binding protein
MNSQDCVVDASFAASWCLPDEQMSGRIERIAETLRGGVIHAPELWMVELTNALLRAERRKRVSSSSVDAFLAEISLIKRRFYSVSDDLSEAMILSRRYQLSVYDALYIALAARLGLPLATLDTQQSFAAKSEGVALLLS